MKWVTREFVHFDRVATPWLLLRFVDPQAELLFVPWGCEEQRPADAIPFAIPGVELSDHDAEGSTFEKVIVKYGLDDPGLAAMARVISYGVGHILWDKAPPRNDRHGMVMEGVMAIAEGIMLSSKSDLETIERSLPVFDGLYALFRAEELLARRNDPPPRPGVGTGLWRTMFVAALTQWVRKDGRGFDGRCAVQDDEAFEGMLRQMRNA